MPTLTRRRQSATLPGVLDDYAFTVIACLDAYEASADLSYFHFAEKIAAAMIARFDDPHEGGFFDMATGPRRWRRVGAGRARRAAQTFAGFADSRGQSSGGHCAACDCMRTPMIAQHRDVAEGTLKAFAGIAAHYGLFAATYGIALDMYLHPHTQVVIAGSGEQADKLEAAALAPLSLNKSVLHLPEGEIVAADASAGAGRNHSQSCRRSKKEDRGGGVQRLYLPAADCGCGELAKQLADALR